MKKNKIGSFTFVLHSHLPYVVSHGKWPHGTDWLNEAAAETYIPLLSVVDRLASEGIPSKLTIGITPILCEQLKDESFKQGFVEYLKTKINSAIADKKEFSKHGKEDMFVLARKWEEYYGKVLDDFTNKYDSDVVEAFRKHQDAGNIEIITCAATHGYLPLISLDTSVQAQIKQGIKTYKRHFSRQPKGIWLPECAYRPRYKWKIPLEDSKTEGYARKGIEEFLSENFIDYFIIDSHMLKGGKAIGVYIDRFKALKYLLANIEKEYNPKPEQFDKNPYEPYRVGADKKGIKPVAVFTRDPKSGLQVWSGEHGYPGNEWYLEFHKKHFPGGHRYWRISTSKSDLGSKNPYDLEKVRERVRENADHFRNMIKEILAEHKKETGNTGILVAPFDAELFGHWWFEGIEWLYHVLKGLSEEGEVELVTCGEYLDRKPVTMLISLPEGSWGEGGFHWIWLNDWTKWTWKHIYEAEKKFQSFLDKNGYKDDEKLERILKQTARELLLMESSDWQFLISTWSARDYAERRFSEHTEDFDRLLKMADEYAERKNLKEGDWNFLSDCEKKDNIFEDIELDWFRKLEYEDSNSV